MTEIERIEKALCSSVYYLRVEVAELVAHCGLLQMRIEKYGGHLESCRKTIGKKCTCGWEECDEQTKGEDT